MMTRRPLVDSLRPLIQIDRSWRLLRLRVYVGRLALTTCKYDVLSYLCFLVVLLVTHGSLAVFFYRLWNTEPEICMHTIFRIMDIAGLFVRSDLLSPVTIPGGIVVQCARFHTMALVEMLAMMYL